MCFYLGHADFEKSDRLVFYPVDLVDNLEVDLYDLLDELNGDSGTDYSGEVFMTDNPTKTVPYLKAQENCEKVVMHWEEVENSYDTSFVCYDYASEFWIAINCGG